MRKAWNYVKAHWLRNQLKLMDRVLAKEKKSSKENLRVLAWVITESVVVSSITILAMVGGFMFKLSSFSHGMVFLIGAIPVAATLYFGSRKLYSVFELGPYTYANANKLRAKTQAKLKALTDA